MSLHRDAHQIAETALTILRKLTDRDRHNRGVLDRIHDAHNANPTAANYDADRVTATGTTDPTANAALRHDQAKTDLATIGRQLEAARTNLNNVAVILANYAPRQASQTDRARMATDNEPHCESCARLEITEGIPRWEPPLTQERTTVGDRLTEPVWLCRWCYDHAVACGCKPTVEELTDHHAGVRVRCNHPRTIPSVGDK